MNFNSLQFLIFLPVVLVLYYSCRHSWRNIVLLAASYYFYICWNPLYSLLLLSSTLITYLSAFLMEKRTRRTKTVLLSISLALNLSILFCFKYYNFIADLIYTALHAAGLAAAPSTLNLLLPVGISFYIFQALGYTMDVYRGDTKAERDFFVYALFVSFFPQLVAGPIERSANLLPQFKKSRPFDFENIKAGFAPLLWGFFKKMVLADQLAAFVNNIYEAPAAFSGTELGLATVVFAFQIYCDFSAYSDIARGSAKMLGFSLMQNFNRPYFAVSIKDFWHRWHISLSSWFRDYLYKPLGGSRCKRWRVYVNVLVVFAVSGLWHGAALSFVFWGCLNGLYQIIGELMQPFRKRFYVLLRVPAHSKLLALLRCVATFILVCSTWVFFRASSIGEAFYILQTIVGNLFADGLFWSTVADLERAHILSLIQIALCLVLLLLVDYLSQKQAMQKRFEDSIWLRYGSYFALLVMILLFGAYGPNFSPLDFVYFQF